jgi:hypothetical protein
LVGPTIRSRADYPEVVLLEEVDGRGYYDAMYQITQRKLMREYL